MGDGRAIAEIQLNCHCIPRAAKFYLTVTGDLPLKPYHIPQIRNGDQVIVRMVKLRRQFQHGESAISDEQFTPTKMLISIKTS